MQVRAHLRLLPQRLDQRVAYVDHLHRGEPHPLHALDLGGLHHQLAELPPILRIAVVAHADPRHHHLRLARAHARPHLLQHGGGRARARRPAHGGDDAVGAVAVAAVLHLHEAARACGGRAGLQARDPRVVAVKRARQCTVRHRMPRATRGQPSPRTANLRAALPATDQQLVLQIHTSSERARHRLRHILRRARERAHRGVYLRELTRSQVGSAAAHVHLARTALQGAAHRLTGLRLRLTGDATGVDHVQLRLLLRRLHVPGFQQRLAGEHRVRVRDLAAEELHREVHPPRRVPRRPSSGAMAPRQIFRLWIIDPCEAIPSELRRCLRCVAS